MSRGNGFEPRGRAKRRARRQAQRRAAGALVVAAALVAGAFAVKASSGPEEGSSPSPSPSRPGGTSNLMLFTVLADQPFTAIVGTGGGRPPAVVAIPYNLLATLPGVGSGTVASALRESGAFGRTAMANLLGAWLPHYADIGLKDLSAILAARGGITVDLPRAVKVAGKTTGPGPVRLSGPQAAGFLDEATGGDRNLRWELVLEQLFSEPVNLPDAAESDDRQAAREALDAASGAVVGGFPSTLSEGGYRVANVDSTRKMLSDIFGVSEPLPAPVVLLSGVDRPTLPQSVTALLVPEGFRIVAYGDAKGMHHERTLIYVSGSEALPQAEVLKGILGVGKVFSSKQQSGLSDITVIVGKDYLASIGR